MPLSAYSVNFMKYESLGVFACLVSLDSNNRLYHRKRMLQKVIEYEMRQNSAGTVSYGR